jgi:hypothetical protein
MALRMTLGSEKVFLSGQDKAREEMREDCERLLKQGLQQTDQGIVTSNSVRSDKTVSSALAMAAPCKVGTPVIKNLKHYTHQGA